MKKSDYKFYQYLVSRYYVDFTKPSKAELEYLFHYVKELHEAYEAKEKELESVRKCAMEMLNR